jgi:hypothetical protein
MPSIDRNAFDNSAVAGCTNPSSFGWHYGEHMFIRVFIRAYTKHMQDSSDIELVWLQHMHNLCLD